MMKPIKLDAHTIQSKNGGAVKHIVTPEFKKVKFMKGPTANLIRSKVDPGLVQAKTKKPRRFQGIPLVRILAADILKLNKNIEGHRDFKGSHVSHFMKAMNDHSLKAKKFENLKTKPVCEGLNLYVSLFDCERR